MTLFSAYEDFVIRTLGALKGPWERLIFVAGLRGETGYHEHWGLEYTHGPQEAKGAMAQAHTEIFQKVLETPVPELWEESEAVSRKQKSLVQNLDQMVPTDRNGCSSEHFHYIMEALTLLAAARSSRQAA
jgi:hypothetical protein